MDQSIKLGNVGITDNNGLDIASISRYQDQTASEVPTEVKQMARAELKRVANVFSSHQKRRNTRSVTPASRLATLSQQVSHNQSGLIIAE
jgi:hypothetical protein